MQNHGMPLWIKVMLILIFLGIILGYVLAKNLPKFTEEPKQINPISSESPNTGVEPMSVSKSSLNVAEISPRPIPVTEMINSPKFSEAQSDAIKEASQDRVLQGVDQAAKAVLLNVENEKKALTQTPSSPVELDQKDEKFEQEKTRSKTNLISKIEFKLESKSDVQSNAFEKTSPPSNTRQKNSPNSLNSSQTKPVSEVLTNQTVTRLSQEEIQSMVRSFKTMIVTGKKNEANEILAILMKNLAPESLTLLTLRAWSELKVGDQNTALSLYQQIVARSPDDESASINLAVLYWNKGMQAEAQKVITAISEVYPNSSLVQQYSRQFGVQR
jgi:tetratricopeptide (TPR) repeat protein